MVTAIDTTATATKTIKPQKGKGKLTGIPLKSCLGLLSLAADLMERTQVCTTVIWATF
jgi:hypothetical protein